MFKIFSRLLGFLQFNFFGYSNVEDDPFYSDGCGLGLGELHGTINGDGFGVGCIGIDDVGFGDSYGYEDGDGRIHYNHSLMEESDA
jgi:hypothetical protein